MLLAGGLVAVLAFGISALAGGEDARKVISGTYGPDRLIGTNHRDTIRGRGGDDVLRGKRGYDRLNAGDGNDLIRGRGGVDRINCGPGKDTAHVNRVEDGVYDCERVIPRPLGR